MARYYWRIAATVVVLLVIGFVSAYLSDAPMGTIGAGLAVDQVNGGDSEFHDMQAFERAKQYPVVLAGLLSLGWIILMWGGPAVGGWRKVMGTRGRTTGLVVLLSLMLSLAGCRRTYDTPEYVEVGTNETAYVVTLEGEDKQSKFASAEALEQLKVATKRIRVSHRWNQTGRWDSTGAWIATVRVIKVDRSPVTREWTTGTSTGTARKDQAIWAESKDSVGFSTGFSVSAMIEEPDASLFLYRYTSKNLENIMDTEIRARVQSAFADAASDYDLSDLRSKKAEVIAAVRQDAIPFFKKRGITITTLGMFGGLSYENGSIQESIDKVFIAQREKEISAALLAAQTDKNKRIEEEAKALANKEIEIARGIAEGKRLVLSVAEAAAKSPVFIKMRELEVEEARIQRWDGKYPTYMMSMGTDSGPGVMLQIPTTASR